jgi:ribosome maturation protein SDO1
VSGKERQQSLSVLFKDVATLIVEKCINSETKQSLTIGQVETAMKECHVALDPNKSAKQQALKIIKLLEEKSSLPIERAKMRLQIDVSEEVVTDLDNYSKELEVENKMVLKQGEGSPTVLRLTVLIVPSFYRDLDLKVKEKGGKVEVLVHSVKPESIQVF